jgi:hypothetical protein
MKQYDQLKSTIKEINDLSEGEKEILMEDLHDAYSLENSSSLMFLLIGILTIAMTFFFGKPDIFIWIMFGVSIYDLIQGIRYLVLREMIWRYVKIVDKAMKDTKEKTEDKKDK